jgi:hypothetical protein
VRRSALALALVLALAGCGTPEDISAFAEEYRALSAAHEQRLNELTEAADPEGDRDALLGVYEEFRELAAEARDGYATLDAPDDVAVAVDRLVDNLDRQVAALDRVVVAAAADDAAALAGHLEDLAGLVADWASVHQLILERLPE